MDYEDNENKKVRIDILKPRIKAFDIESDFDYKSGWLDDDKSSVLDSETIKQLMSSAVISSASTRQSMFGGGAMTSTTSSDSAKEARTFDHVGMLKRMMAVVKDDPALVVAVLKDKELAEWWSAEKEKQRVKDMLLAQKLKAEELRRGALAKLTYEERKALGL